MRLVRSLGASYGRRTALAAAIVTLALGVACGGAAPTTPQPTRTNAPATASPAAIPTPARPALASPSPTLPAPTPAPARPTAAPSQTYTVEAGDTLLKIAEKVYGDATLWRRIYEANRSVIGDDPDKLAVEMKLQIPPKDS